jgi:predicted RNA binding protein YcfA (HicA-like mRNA interferase family)
MSKLHSSRQIEKTLIRFGFEFVSQKGSHRKYKGNFRTVIVPTNKAEIPLGTFRSILRQANLREEDFL